MSDIGRSISRGQQIRTISERVQDMEMRIPMFLAQANSSLNNLAGRLGENAEILNALVELFGQDIVSQRVNENRLKRATEQAEEQKAGIAEGVKKGLLVPATVVGEKTLIVTEVKDKDGNVEPPGRLQMEAAKLTPAFRPLFEGKGVGTVVPAPAGGTLTITDLYDAVDPPPAAANTDAQQAPTVAPAADASATAAPTDTTLGVSPSAPSADAATAPIQDATAPAGEATPPAADAVAGTVDFNFSA